MLENTPLNSASNATHQPRTEVQGDFGFDPDIVRRNHYPQKSLDAVRERNESTKLNPEQQQVVDIVYGPKKVTAGPGTGKTKTVISDVINKITVHRVQPPRICCLTFTNNAANEMRNRYKAIVKPEISQVPTFSTFHSLCGKILDRHSHVLGYDTRPKIVRSKYQKSLITHALESMTPGEVEGFGKKPERELASRIGRWKNELLTPEQVYEKYVDVERRHLEENYYGLPPKNPYAGYTGYKNYQDNLNSGAAIDVDDLILKAHQILTSVPEILKLEQDRFDYVNVDEFQDTNKAQYVIVSLLAAVHKNLCVVGDPDQAIYAFRGGDAQIFDTFEKDWEDTNVINLVTNYRSTASIVEKANNLISWQTRRKPRKVVAATPGGKDPEILRFESEHEQAVWIAEKCASCGYPLDKIAIIVRNGSEQDPIKAALEEQELPFIDYTSKDKRMSEVMLNSYSLFDAIHEPSKAHFAFFNLLRSSRFSLSKSDQDLVHNYRDQGISYWEILTGELSSRLSKDGQEKAAALSEMVRKFHHRADPLIRAESKDTIARIAKDAMRELYPEIATRKDWTSLDSQHHLKLFQMQLIYRHIVSWERKKKKNRVLTFETFLGYDEYLLSIQNMPREKGIPALSYMTGHASKGTEFELVIHANCSEGIIPSIYALESPIPEETTKAIEEERNLQYVIMTRAEKELYVCSAPSKVDKNVVNSGPSRFIMEMHHFNQAH